MQHMLDRGIATRRGIMCAHREQPYRHLPGVLPHSEWCQDHTVVLPLYVQMSAGDVDRVAEELIESVDRALAASVAS